MAGVLQAKWIPAADFKKGRGGKSIKGCVLHSTCGRRLGDIETLTGEGGPVVSCHFYVTRNGTLYQFVKESDTAFHAGRVLKSEWGNTTTVGLEMEHFDPDERHPHGENWPDEQLKVVAKLIAYLRQKYGTQLPVKGHAEIAAPKGRKQDPHSLPWQALGLLVMTAMKTEWTLETR